MKTAEDLDKNEVQYDVISGISVGAINAAGISLFPKGQEEEATQFMIDKWNNID